MNLPESSEDLFQPEALKAYNQESKVLWTSLTHLHTNLRMLRQLGEYRTEFFEVPRAFVYLLAVNLLQYSVIIVHRLWSDRGKNRLTLKRFRHHVEGWVRSEYREALLARVAGVIPPENHEQILARVEAARHKRLAHLDGRYHLSRITAATEVTIEELDRVASWLGRVFNALTAEEHHTYVVIEMVGEQPWEGELGYVLETLAARSRWVESWDRWPEYWRQTLRPQLSTEDLEDINRVRKAAGLDPVSDTTSGAL